MFCPGATKREIYVKNNFWVSIISLFFVHIFLVASSAFAQTQFGFEIIAQTGESLPGTERINLLGRGPSINDLGHVAFTANDDLGRRGVFVETEGTIDSREVYSPLFFFGQLVQINNQDQVVWREQSVNGLNSAIKRLGPTNDDFKIVADSEFLTGGINSPFAPRSQIFPDEPLKEGVTLSNKVNGSSRVVFGGVLKDQQFPPTVLATPKDTENGEHNVAEDYFISGSLFGSLEHYPMVADNNTTIIKWGNLVNDSILLFTDELLSTAVQIAPSTDFLEIGQRPGISDDGKKMAFMANHPTSGAGIWVAEYDAQNNLVQRWKVANIPNDSPLNSRVGINHSNGTGGAIFRIVYLANGASGQLGLYTNEVDFTGQGDPIVMGPTLIVEVGNFIPILDLGVIQQIDIYDPANNSGDIVFWVQHISGEAIIKGKPLSLKANFTISTDTPQLNVPIGFDASSSTAPGGNQIINFTWDFGDGEVGQGETMNHSYSRAGVFTVKLTVEDNEGSQAITSKQVRVGNPPKAIFTFQPENPGVPGIVAFDASGSFDLDGQLQPNDFIWDFGFGTSGLIGPNPNFGYNEPGVFTVTLTVRDAGCFPNANCLTDTEQAQIVVGDPPSVDFTFAPFNPTVQIPITFNPLAQAFDGGEIVLCRWDFGDGENFENNCNERPGHTYTLPQEYEVTLTVEDNFGRTRQITKKVNVIPENWSVEWLPGIDEIEMGKDKRYVITLKVTNLVNSPAVFDYRVNHESSLDEQNNWDLGDDGLTIGPCRFSLNGEPLSETFNPLETKELPCVISHRWNWIEPLDLERTVEEVNEFNRSGLMDLIEKKFKNVIGFIERIDDILLFLDLVAERQLVTRLETYVVSGPDVVNTDVREITVKVGIDKQISRYLSLGFLEAANKMTFGAITSCLIPEPAFSKLACASLAIGEAGALLAGERLREIAIDPRDDFTVLSKPVRVSVPALEELEDSPEKSLASNSILIASRAEAALLSYARFLGALDAGELQWAAAQRSATKLHLNIMKSKVEIVSTELEKIIPNIPIPDENKIAQIRDFLNTTGLPEAEVQVLQAFGISNDQINAIADHFLTLDDAELSDFQELPQDTKLLSDSLGLLISNIHPLPPGVVEASVTFVPNRLIVGQVPDNINAFIELPEGHDPQSILDSTILLNGLIQANQADFTIVDQDGNGIPELQITFDGTLISPLLNEGDQALSLTGELNDGTKWGGLGVVKVEDLNVNTVTVPNIVGLAKSEAETVMNASVLNIGSVSLESSNVVPSGSVIRQVPPAGTQVIEGSSVDLIVSSGLLNGLEISSISPQAGLVIGGTLVTIAGTNFGAVSSVTIGGNPLVNLMIIDENTIMGNVPPGSAGLVDVVVSGPPGFAILSKGFLYQEGVPAQGSALRFDGINDLVTFGTVTPLAEHTLEAWVKPTATTNGVIFGQISGPGQFCGFGTMLFGSGETLFYDVDPASCNTAHFLDHTSNTLGLWTHIAGTFNDSTARLYINGQLVKELAGVSFAPSTWMTAGAITFGNGNQSFFSGDIDELRIWNFARSVKEIQGTMQRPLAGDETGLIGYWNLNDGSGQSVQGGNLESVTGTLGTNNSIQPTDPIWVQSGAPLFQLPLITVPDVVGLLEAVGVLEIQNAGLVSGNTTTQAHNTIPAGHVISQTPEAGSGVEAGAVVDFVVSTGPAPVTVPDVGGLLQTDAEDTLVGAALLVGTINTVSNSDVPAGVVLSQTPMGGDSVLPNTAVDLVISSGPPLISIPDVVGLPQSDAENTLISAGLGVGEITTASNATIPAGTVISQGPSAGEQVEEGTGINLVISSGPPMVDVPNVVGLDQGLAVPILEEAGLSPGTITTENSQTVPAGKVISQSVAPGMSVEPGTPVDLVVSAGPPLAAVPDLTGLDQAAAEAALLEAGFQPGNVSREDDPVVPVGQVSSQSPAGGELAPEGSPIDFALSAGPGLIAVPVVVELPQGEGEDDITEVGLTVGCLATLPSTTVPEGDIISQHPPEGTRLAPGSGITIVVSSGPPLDSTPDGFSSGTFENPQGPPTMVTTGVGTDQFSWGDPGSFGTGPSSLGFAGGPFTVVPEEPVKLGIISYFNGTVEVDSQADTAQLQLDLSVQSDGPTPNLFSVPNDLTFTNTPNIIGSPPADQADIVSLPNLAPDTLIKVNGKDHTLELSFGEVTPASDGFSEIDKFSVLENHNACAELRGVFTPVEEEILVCDVDGNTQIDINDIRTIFAARGQTATGPDDPRDSNGDGLISINDGRLCVLQCAKPRCAP